MIKFHSNISPFWTDSLKDYRYTQIVPFVAKNFDHLDRNYYDKGHILQSFNDDVPKRSEFNRALNLGESSISWTCILPNSILPTHRDTFYTLRQQHNVDIKDCYRFLIFLEDWVFGQYVGFENKNITNWKAGDAWKFDSVELHYGVNASNLYFHTCQVSGFNR